jgi:hypothetical protein
MALAVIVLGALAVDSYKVVWPLVLVVVAIVLCLDHFDVL